MRRGCLIGPFGALACALFVASAPAAAQRVQSSIVVGGVGVRYTDAVNVTVLNLHPTLSVQTTHTSLAGLATFSRPLTGGWSAQGQVAGSAFTPSAGPLSAEFTGVGGGSTNADGEGTGQLQMIGRAHAAGYRGGIWAGAGAGRVWDGTEWRVNRIGEIGSWLRVSNVGLTASYTPTILADTVRYADTQLSARWRTPGIELDAFLGIRQGLNSVDGMIEPGTWGGLSASVRISPRMAIVASGGTYPLDLLQGFPSGRFTSLGLRITGPGSGPAPAVARAAIELSQERAARNGLTSFRVRSRAARSREIRVRASGARTVEITGDFTGWSPVALSAVAEGWWILVVDLAPGSYEMNLRIDGGAWLVPPDLPTRRDEFGGVSAILTVSGTG